MSYAAIVAVLLHSLLIVYLPAQLASAAAPTQAGAVPDTTAIDQKCPNGPEYDYTCDFGTRSQSQKVTDFCMKNLPVGSDMVRGDCVGPGKVEGTMYKNQNGDWVDFTSGLPCSTNGDCAPGVNSAQPSYSEGSPMPPSSQLNIAGDMDILQPAPLGSSAVVFNETTGQYEYAPTNEITQLPMQEYERPPSELNAFGEGFLIQPIGPIPSEYVPLPGEQWMVGSNGTLFQERQAQTQLNQDVPSNTYVPLAPSTGFSSEPQAPQSSLNSAPAPRGNTISNFESDVTKIWNSIFADI